VTDDDRNFARDALYVLFRYRLRIVLLTLTSVGVVAAAIALGGGTYTASARIVVTAAGSAGQGAQATLVLANNGQSARNQAELFADPGLLRPLLPVLKARLQAVRPRPAAQELARLETWLAAKLRVRAWAWIWTGAGDWLVGPSDPDEVLLLRLRHALTAAAIGDTDVVALRFTWPDADFAADALNLMLSGDESAVAQAAGARLDIKLADAALHDADAQVQALDDQLAFVPIGQDAASLERQRDRIASRLAASRSTGDALRVERELSHRKLETVERAYRSGGWVDSPDAQDTPAGAPELQQTFVTLLDKHQMMLSHLPPDSAKVRAVDHQIGEVREQNYLAVKQVLTSRLATLDERLSRLNADIAADEASARDTDDSLVKLDALAQSRAAAAARAAVAQRRYDDAKLAVDALARNVSGIRVLSPAAPPPRPDAPAPGLLLVLALVGGLAMGVLSALLAELTRRTMDRPRDIARLLDVEVLARVPDLRV
jgi:uncharacterized protein involved in exopolysaccharide biosynthesis